MKRLLLIVLLACVTAAAANYPEPKPGDFTVRNFHYKAGEQADVRLHYYTLGTPAKDGSGRVTNAVLILHGTGGSGRSLLNDSFAGVLFCPGCLLDATKYFIVSPDNVGHGQSSKPSDGQRMRFPQYDYDDMVALQHALLVDGLGVNHARLIMGTSMGCMHSWVWGEAYPDFMDALMPLACLPVEIAGRNRMWRKMLIDGIKSDPAWNGGNYTSPPQQGLRTAADLLILAGSAPLWNQKQAPTRQAAETLLDQRVAGYMRSMDANDALYQFDASRNYNPDPKLETIQAEVMAVNSADDFINPPELGILEREIRRVKHGRALVLPVTDQTRGHGTHTIASIWGAYLADLLEHSGGMLPGTTWSGAPEQAMPSPMAGPSVAPGSGDGTGRGAADAQQWMQEAAAQFGRIYRVGNGVTPPQRQYTPDPQYTDSAREQKHQGTAVLWIVVTPDGTVHNVHVMRSTGDTSLDEQAARTVGTWKFEPARREGVPVAVQISVEMNFKLQ